MRRLRRLWVVVRDLAYKITAPNYVPSHGRTPHEAHPHQAEHQAQDQLEELKGPAMTKLVFLDTETTSLRPDRRAWEIAAIVREPGQEDREHQWLIDLADLDRGNADPLSLRIGGFHARHPQLDPSTYGWDDSLGIRVVREAFALRELEWLTAGAHIVGAVPSFDAEVLAARMHANGLCPTWSHHLIDVEPLIIGYLAAKGEAVDMPWKSDDLSRRMGVEPPSGEDRHTALGDARWCVRIYDAVMSKQ